MELWIRSQDKSCLVNIRAVIMLNKEIRGYYNENPNWFLGKYDNEERALEVLDEIQDLIKPKIITTDYECECKNNPVDKLSFNLEMKPTKTEITELSTYVYEMPKE